MCSDDSNLKDLSIKKDGSHAMLKCNNLEEDLQFQPSMQQETKSVVSSKLLKVNVLVPSAEGVVKVDKEDDHECRTPKEVINQYDGHIKMKCPAAPRKPKSVPSKKRKMEERNVVSIQVSHSEVQLLLFSQDFAVFGGNIMKKKVKQENIVN